MAGKTWFLTGTSKGFGREWAIAALDRGDRVAATARNIATLKDLVDTYGDAILPMQLDVTDCNAEACWRSHLERARWIVGDGLGSALVAFNQRSLKS